MKAANTRTRDIWFRAACVLFPTVIAVVVASVAAHRDLTYVTKAVEETSMSLRKHNTDVEAHPAAMRVIAQNRWAIEQIEPQVAQIRQDQAQIRQAQDALPAEIRAMIRDTLRARPSGRQ